MANIDAKRFEEFVKLVEPQLRRALSGHLPRHEVADGVAEALTYAWEHRERVLDMESPVGYLYRVAQSRSRSRKEGFLPWAGDERAADTEPGLDDAIAALPAGQARAVWLVSACGWSHTEASAALDVSASTISTQVSRGMVRLRREMGVVTDG